MVTLLDASSKSYGCLSTPLDLSLSYLEGSNTRSDTEDLYLVKELSQAVCH